MTNPAHRLSSEPKSPKWPKRKRWRAVLVRCIGRKPIAWNDRTETAEVTGPARGKTFSSRHVAEGYVFARNRAQIEASSRELFVIVPVHRNHHFEISDVIVRGIPAYDA